MAPCGPCCTLTGAFVLVSFALYVMDWNSPGGGAPVLVEVTQDPYETILPPQTLGGGAAAANATDDGPRTKSNAPCLFGAWTWPIFPAVRTTPGVMMRMDDDALADATDLGPKSIKTGDADDDFKIFVMRADRAETPATFDKNEFDSPFKRRSPSSREKKHLRGAAAAKVEAGKKSDVVKKWLAAALLVFFFACIIALFCNFRGGLRRSPSAAKLARFDAERNVDVICEVV